MLTHLLMEQAQHGARLLSTNGAPTLRVKGSLSTIKESDLPRVALLTTKHRLTSPFLKFPFRALNTTAKETC